MVCEFQDDLVSVKSASLRALGVIVPGAASAVVCFGEGADALRRDVKLWHRVWSHGRGLSLFLCPRCERKTQILRMYDGRLQCRKCLMRQKIQFKIAYGTRAERPRRGRSGLRSCGRSLPGVRFGLTGGGLGGGGSWNGRRGELNPRTRGLLEAET